LAIAPDMAQQMITGSLRLMSRTLAGRPGYQAPPPPPPEKQEAKTFRAIIGSCAAPYRRRARRGRPGIERQPAAARPNSSEDGARIG
jgi:hypothetical protein